MLSEITRASFVKGMTTVSIPLALLMNYRFMLGASPPYPCSSNGVKESISSDKAPMKQTLMTARVMARAFLFNMSSEQGWASYFLQS